MYRITPVSYDSEPPWDGYYIDLPFRVTLYVGRQKPWGWWSPSVSVFLRKPESHS